jgi:hypothetical protein
MAADFRKALLSELGDADMPAPVEARLRGRLGASLHARRTWWQYPAVALAACAAGALLVFVAIRPPRAPEALAGMNVERASIGFEAAAIGDEVVVKKGDATLRDPRSGATLTVTRPGTLRHEKRGLRVVSGRVDLDVDKRLAGAEPMRVLVSHGEIEVRGTRFSVDQLEGGGGAALLLEGRIVFRADDGREVVLLPGQSVAWPLPPPPPQAPPEKKDDESFEAQPDQDVLAPLPVGPDAGWADWSAHDRLLRAHTLLERIPKLRAQGRFVQAADELESAMKQDLPAPARERLSFELIDILANELWDNPRACRFVKDHAWRYPAGRYEDEIVRIREELNCTP